MTTEDKEQRRKRINRKKQDNVHNIYAKDLRTPKYKMRVVPSKKVTESEGNLLKKVR